ncbi:aconitate hydratase [bacterium]|nr:aconitate hydratase [bacterium]
MGKNLVEKILEKHLMDGNLKSGDEIGVKIDQTLTQDATGTMAYLQFESMGVPRVKTALSVSYVDHNTLQQGFENADDHRYLQSFSYKYGLLYSKAGNGICHQVNLERYGKPGWTLLGSDSHTPTGGGLGMLAIGAGGLDIAVAMAGGAFYMPRPKTLQVKLTGKLQPWVSAKDIILKVLEILTTKGNVGYILEYTGEGVDSLTVPQRATITNMGAEVGVTTSIFPSDEQTRLFLKAQGREEDWIQLSADSDAIYDKTIEIDLNRLEPLIAKPHSPDNIDTVANLKGTKVHQVLVGSCTNSSYYDLMLVASVLKGKKVHPDVSFGVAPGSRQVFQMIAANGALGDIILSGARILESACGFCIGAGQAPGHNEVSLRTNNRNFEGRSGTKTAQVHLVSPEVAVASAIAGVIADPRDLGEAINVEIPETFRIDDSMVIEPADISFANSVEILRGPNIGLPPQTDPLQNSISGVATIKLGDKITTDHIMPAGARLKFRSNIPKYSEYVFEGVDSQFSTRSSENRDKGVANFIIAGSSYGQGSSREHAAICPMYLGVKAVIVKSFERIHKANLINFGIVPLTFVNEDDYNKIEQSDELILENIEINIKEKKDITLFNKTKNISIELNLDISDRQREILLVGGTLNYMKKQQ